MLGTLRIGGDMPGSSSPNVKNEKQYEALKDKGMSKERAAKIANSPDASSKGGKKSGSGGNSKQGGTTAQKKVPGAKAARQQPRSLRQEDQWLTRNSPIPT
jgi:hypothetical protein